MSLIDEIKNCSGKDLMLIRNLFEFSKQAEEFEDKIRKTFSDLLLGKGEISLDSNNSNGVYNFVTRDYIWKHMAPSNSWEFNCSKENVFDCLKSYYLAKNEPLSLSESIKLFEQYEHLEYIMKKMSIYKK